jgi:histone deacetylase 1/2
MFDKLKARLVAGGNRQDRSVYSESDTSSPTVATEAVMMIAAIAARERRHVVTIDIGGAFLRGKFKDGSDPVVMRLEKELADTLCAIDPGYEAYLRPDGSMYVKLTRPLYGLIEAAKLWFEEISSTLKREGFVQNQYDQCTWNRDFNGHQHTVVLHVDDLKSTCKDDKANQQLINALRTKYKDINVQEGLIHPYLGMTFDYSVEGKVRVTQDGYVSELVASEDIKSAVKTPANEDLFVIDSNSAELNKEAKEHFHSLTAKLLYLSKRTRPDILVAVSFLTSRVQVATEQDGAKLTRVLRYLSGTQNLGIVLEADDQLLKLYCYIDASFGVHADAKSHTGTLVTLGKGPIMAKSVKQKINTKSSTEAELVGLSDSVSLVIWCRNFLESQGYKMPPASVFQDNLSTIAMVKNGKHTSDRTRHVNIRFFFVHDREANEEIRVEYKPTKQML